MVRRLRLRRSRDSWRNIFLAVTSLDTATSISPNWASALASTAAATYMHGDLVLLDPLIHHASPPLLSGRYLPNGLLGLRSLTNRDASHLDLDFGRLLSPSATALVGIFPHVFFKRGEFPFKLFKPLIIGLLKPSLFGN